MSREYDLKLNGEFYISRHRYRELKAFCLQYEEKKSELNQIYTSSSVSPEITVMGGIPGKPTEQKALRATQLKNDIELIEKCLKEACGVDVGLYEPLKRNITLGVGFDGLGAVSCGINQFYKKRKKFFFLLNFEKW